MEKIEIKKIGKKEALDILKNNKNNRRVTRANVDFIKDEMQNGRFLVNGATIVISEDGELLDGQHRLIAISETDLEFDLIFVLNANKNVFSTIDTGRNRKAGDVLSVAGVKNYNNIASATKKIMSEFDTNRKLSDSGSIKSSNSEVLDYYKKHKDEIQEAVEFSHLLYNRHIKIITVSNAAAMIVLFSREDSRKSKSFIREVFTGEKEGYSNAALTLRQRLINYRIDNVRLTTKLLRALFIISFRAYREDRDISKILVKKDVKGYVFKSELI